MTHDLDAFKQECDVIVANRFTDELEDVFEKSLHQRLIYERLKGEMEKNYVDQRGVIGV